MLLLLMEIAIICSILPFWNSLSTFGRYLFTLELLSSEAAYLLGVGLDLLTPPIKIVNSYGYPICNLDNNVLRDNFWLESARRGF